MASKHFRKVQARREFERCYDPDDVDTEEIVGVVRLSELSGCSVATIRRFAGNGVLPACGIDDRGRPSFDLADERVYEWVRALQCAGYHQRPAGAA